MRAAGSATAMTRHAKDARPTGISEPFASRLARLKPRQVMRAIVMVHVAPPRKDPTRRMSRQERRDAIAAMRQAAQPALVEVDEILEQFNGKRLEETVSALGTVLVEATAAGIRALAQSPKIKAVMEDQSIRPLSTPKD